MRVYDKGRTLSKLDEEIAEMEAEFLREQSAEQDGNPDGSFEEPEVLTDTPAVEKTTRKDSSEESQNEISRLTKELADERHRFGRYKGSTDKTIFGLRSEVKQLTEKLNSVWDELNRTRSKLAELDNPMESIFNQDVVDVLGEEAVEAIKKSIDLANQRAANVEKRFVEDERRKQTERVKALEQKNVDEFYAGLTELVPDFKVWNNDPGFLDWLMKTDPRGVVRFDELRMHQDAYDYKSVAEFFDEYKGIVAQSAAAKSGQEDQDSIDAYLGPLGSKGNASSEHAKKTLPEGSMLQSEINRFYRDSAKGKYKWRPTDAEDIEARIFAAEQSGNVVYDEDPI